LLTRNNALRWRSLAGLLDSALDSLSFLAFLVSLYIYVADKQQVESLARSFSRTWFIHRVRCSRGLDKWENVRNPYQQT
jgi:hypothetical protein